MSTTRYTKAPGYARSPMGYRTLWFGEHELLQVAGVPGREDYEHLFYRDICAIYILPTKRSRVWLGIFGVILAAAIVTGALAMKSQLDEAFIPAAIVFATLSFLIVLNELLRGPSCECYAVTAVQRYQLYPWNRIRRAKRCAALLRERVLRAQG